MKKTIPFDLFGEKQELCFTIQGLAELERATGKTVRQNLNSGNTGFDFCLAALPICLKRTDRATCEKKIEEFLENDHAIEEIAVPVINAIAVTGALGKKIASETLNAYYPELYPLEEESPNE